MLRFTFLGTGTSQGVPMIACDCDVCLSSDKKDKRLRSSVLIQSDKTSVVIDTGPDFRYQMLRVNNKKLDAVVFTHSHKDHIAGLDDIRAYNYLQNKHIAVYANKATWKAIRQEFEYIFAENKYPGIPLIDAFEITAGQKFQIQDISLEAFEVMHYKLPVLGFRINDLVYITDANYLEPKLIEQLKGCKYLILNALRIEKHISHFSLNEAIAIAQEINAEQSYFTHISHLLGKHETVNKILPPKISLAYDGLQIEI